MSFFSSYILIFYMISLFDAKFSMSRTLAFNKNDNLLNLFLFTFFHLSTSNIVEILVSKFLWSMSANN
jgi:hypothetical protein